MRYQGAGRTSGIRVRRAQQTAAWEQMVLFAVIIAMVGALLVSRSPDPSPVETRAVRLEAGDTLWTLAAQHPAAGLNTAQTVDLITALNHLSTTGLHEGRVIMIPTDASPTNSVAMR